MVFLQVWKTASLQIIETVSYCQAKQNYRQTACLRALLAKSCSGESLPDSLLSDVTSKATKR